MWGTKLLIVGIFLFCSFSQAMIFGEDSRRPLTKEYAEQVGLRPVVYLYVQKPAGVLPCTGTWISDVHILTARHCVANAQKVLVINQYHGSLGESRAVGKRVYVDKSSSNNQVDWYNRRGKNNDARPNANDWAVIEIHKEAGGEPKTIINDIGVEVKNLEEYTDGGTNGTIALGDSRILKTNPGLQLAAFHTDANNTLYREFCRYRPRDVKAEFQLMNYPNIFEFDCDAAEGASGAPLLKCDGTTCAIVGIYSGGYSNETNQILVFENRYGNMAVPSTNFMIQVNELLRGNKAYVKQFGLEKPACKLMRCMGIRI